MSRRVRAARSGRGRRVDAPCAVITVARRRRTRFVGRAKWRCCSFACSRRHPAGRGAPRASKSPSSSHAAGYCEELGVSSKRGALGRARSRAPKGWGEHRVTAHVSQRPGPHTAPRRAQAASHTTEPGWLRRVQSRAEKWKRKKNDPRAQLERLVQGGNVRGWPCSAKRNYQFALDDKPGRERYI